MGGVELVGLPKDYVTDIPHVKRLGAWAPQIRLRRGSSAKKRELSILHQAQKNVNLSSKVQQ